MALLNEMPVSGSKSPLFSFGVITDVQYADIPDGQSFLGVPRYYRHSIQVLKRAVKKWNQMENLSFVIHFGDIVDGFCPKEESLSAILRTMKEFDEFKGSVYHIIGNHCLYNLPRDSLISMLKIPSENNYAYYDFTPVPEYCIVVLDGYDISAIGWPEDHPNRVEAVNFLKSRNPNQDKNSPEGLNEIEKRCVMFNGAVGKGQLAWLDNILKDATELNQGVIICCHLPLHPVASCAEALLWNYDEVMDVIYKYNCVKVCLSGHLHEGGYGIDSHGIHHRVLEAVLECPSDTDSFGHIDVYNDRFALIGTGRMKSTNMGLLLD